MLEKTALERAREFNDTVNDAITHSMGIVMANVGCRIAGIPSEYKWAMDVMNDGLNIFKSMCDFIESEAEVLDSLAESNKMLNDKLEALSRNQESMLGYLSDMSRQATK